MAALSKDENQEQPSELIYGNDYLEWKKWEEAKFGTPTKSQLAYYNSEIKRTRLKLPTGARVLEIGFGNGSFLGYARFKEWKVSGIEINEVLVTKAREAGYDVFNNELTLKNFEVNTFDLVIAFDVLEHIPQDKLREFILDVKAILKPDCCFLARFPNGDSPFGLRYQNGDVTHLTALGSGKVNYLSEVTNMRLSFLGGEAKPIFGISLPHSIHNFLSICMIRILDFFVHYCIYPGQSPAPFISPTIVMILQKKDALSLG